MTAVQGVLCAIYKGSREQELYVYVPMEQGEDAIPEALRERMGQLTRVMTLHLTPGRKLARADVANVIRDIHDKGYYLQMPPEISGLVPKDGD